MAPNRWFEEGEKVLCFHGSIIYEAKCLKSKYINDENISYLINYTGWDKSWDEWVPENRVLEYNSANVKKQKDVLKAHKLQSAKGKKTPAKGKTSEAAAAISNTSAQEDSRASIPPEPGSTSAPDKEFTKTQSRDAPSDFDQSKNKRGRLLSIESKEGSIAKSGIKIKIPKKLNEWLVGDWDLITQQHKLILLPPKLTVDQILDNYISLKAITKGRGKYIMRVNITKGIKSYFNAALASQLLYNFEIPQHNEVLLDYPGTPMSKIYGSIHLLRLFTVMGSMLACASLNEATLEQVLYYIHDFINFMEVNKLAFFSLDDYVNATAEYRERANSS